MNDNIIITYCLVDDFCKFCEESQKKFLAKPGVQMRKPTRVPKITPSEIITILLVYQRSHFKDFRNFYGYFRSAYSHFFPNLPTYERFNELQKRVLYLMMLFLKALLVKGSEEGYIDSTKIDVCHLKRSKRNKVFAEKAAAGYSSMGYFYGFKLHLVIDINGNIVNATILPGNESDICPVEKLLKNFKGTIFGDKGYISKKLFENLLKNGTKLVTKIKKNMKNQVMIWRETRPFHKFPNISYIRFVLMRHFSMLDFIEHFIFFLFK